MLRYQCGPYFEEWHCTPPANSGQGYHVLRDQWVLDGAGAWVRQILSIELAEPDPEPAPLYPAAAWVRLQARRESP